MAQLGPIQLTFRLFRFVYRGFTHRKHSTERAEDRHPFVTRNRMPRHVREHPPGRNIAIVFSHWHHLIENFSDSPQGFYQELEEAIGDRQLPGIALARIRYFEHGIFSARREYFRITHEEYVFDVCAALYGKSFIISWWLGLRNKTLIRRILSIIPLIGGMIERSFRARTYYQMDRALAFQDSVHNAVLRVVDHRSSKQGTRAPAGTERRPIMSESFWRGH